MALQMIDAAKGFAPVITARDVCGAIRRCWEGANSEVAGAADDDIAAAAADA